MTLILLHEAEIEFSESVVHYESKEFGLGVRFRDEVTATLAWILAHPELPRLRSRGYRRVNLKVFSHYIAYIIRANVIWVVAIAHARQRPEFWLRRTRS